MNVYMNVRQVVDEIGRLTGVTVDACEILTGRAALLGRSPRGRISAGGSTRLMACRDGWCALTLSRADDIAALPALLETADVADDPWPELEAWAAARSAAAVAERGRLLGLPVAALGETPAAAPRTRPLGRKGPPRAWSELLVADLSAMWAGPLCGQILVRAGATVVKVESPARPDGTRAGPAAFFDWMNGGKLSYAVDFDDARLAALLAVADVVIEASRPAALSRRGLGPTDVAPRDGRVWLRITGHGTDGERANWVAFGDDAAVSGGLVEMTGGGPEFVGDAIADPLTGLHAALAVAESVGRGGGELVELSMAGVAATYATLPAAEHRCAMGARAPRPAASAAPLGADNAAVERLVAERHYAAC